jgi:hypothetical protein
MRIGKTLSRIIAAIAVLGALALRPAAADQQRRELGAHEHGRGTLNIAIEGARINMELEVPGMDVVGFEHAVKSRDEMAAVERGKQLLMGALSLFALPAAAGCELTDAKVALEAEDHDEVAGKDSEEDGTAPHAEEGHRQFHAEYAVECASPRNLTSIDFGYFRIFAAAQKLDVSMITAKGQVKFEVKRDTPHIDLAGMM